ncbi:hypothetical protein [Rubinisphaera margarita]|uniref:hypothetical protein n=1 Tax=Rubinisphaera margarita TaxID=2909586 RepID=UPI001EE9909C|nr:hypothetical protein [Rubinisphaera margarita]MCG6158340.1 hypothetical protein [Rubinisphaera margarita]
MSESERSRIDGWCGQFMRKWIDANEEMSIKALREMNWWSLPVPDVLDSMKAEWLADAIDRLGDEEVVGIAFEFKANPDVERVHVSRDAILEYNFRNTWRTAILTSVSELFVYYKHNSNKYYMLCGDSNFISCSYRCTLDTARKIYFEEYTDLEFNNESERRYMVELWERYVDRK